MLSVDRRAMEHKSYYYLYLSVSGLLSTLFEIFEDFTTVRMFVRRNYRVQNGLNFARCRRTTSSEKNGHEWARNFQKQVCALSLAIAPRARKRIALLNGTRERFLALIVQLLRERVQPRGIDFNGLRHE